jgi:hypothetical protein
VPCALGPNVATVSCRDGVCRNKQCVAGFGNCTDDQGDGCETALTTDSDCGSCGVACGQCTTCSASGACEPAFDGESCDGSDPCYTSFACQGGHCVGETQKTCPTSNPCQIGACDSTTGDYVFSVNPAAIGDPCDEGLACVENSTCQADGSCAGGSPVICDDPPECRTTFPESSATRRPISAPTATNQTTPPVG